MPFMSNVDYFLLARPNGSGSHDALRMPMVDAVIQTLSDCSVLPVFVGPNPPTSNQSVTLWLRPKIPSWIAEGDLFAWNTATNSYAPATPPLVAATLFAQISSEFGHGNVIAGAFDGPPPNVTGGDGDFAIDSVTNLMYGPRESGVWPNTPFNLATTTNYGVAREATVTESETGHTTGSTPAFVTPEGIGALTALVQTALGDAAAAQAAANTAINNAAVAQSTANTALTDAENAQSTANTALANANNAVVLAGNADTAANNAQNTANTALADAENAQNTANTALTDAAAAQSTANTALADAEAAQTTANEALAAAHNASALTTGTVNPARLPVISGSTTQYFGSGSGTYAAPAGVQWIKVRGRGGGAGGVGGGSDDGGGGGGSGGDTAFGPATATGGLAPPLPGGNPGGSATGGNLNVNGAASGSATATTSTNGQAVAGGQGGGLGGGPGGMPTGEGGLAANTPGQGFSGGGGGGGGATPTSSELVVGGAGGGEGGYFEIILAVGAYSWSIGAGGAGGTAGTDGQAGADGGDGYVYVEEFYFA